MMLYQDRLVPEEQIRISPMDRGYYFGDGVYEVFRVYRGQIFETGLHLKRLERSAREIRLELPFASARIEQLLNDIIEAEKLREGIVYLQITRGEAPRAHGYPHDPKPVMLGWCKPVERPLDMLRDGIAAVIRPDIRWLRCDIKSLNLLPNSMLKQEAADAGAGEVILHRDGIVTECSAANVMLVKDGRLVTHPANHLILHGVTRAVALRLAAELGIEVSESPFSVNELREADEVFITGTTVEITPVVSLDGQPVAGRTPGKITRKLQEAFEALI